MREEAQLLAHLLAAAENRREPLVVGGQREEDARDLLVHRGGEEAERLDARLLGRERRVVGIGAERGVHVRGHLAEPSQPVEEALGRGRDLAEGQLPAPDCAGDVLLQQAERRGERPAGVAVPAAERRDVAEALRGEEAQHLELRVDPGLDAAEDLEDQRVVEHDRAVRLLGGDEPHRPELAAEGGEVLRRAELGHALRALERHAGPHRADDLPRDPRVLREAVEGGAFVVARDEQLVDVVRPRVEAHLDEGERQLRLGLPDRDGVEHLRVRDRPRLRAVPALPGHVLDQRPLVHLTPPASSGLSWNQKNPRGASVRR